MSEIDTKRKAIEYSIVDGDDDFEYNQGKLEGFDLGVSMEKKENIAFRIEIIDKTIRMLNTCQARAESGHSVIQFCKTKKKELEELKQLLGEKT